MRLNNCFWLRMGSGWKTVLTACGVREGLNKSGSCSTCWFFPSRSGLPSPFSCLVFFVVSASLDTRGPCPEYACQPGISGQPGSVWCTRFLLGSFWPPWFSWFRLSWVFPVKDGLFFAVPDEITNDVAGFRFRKDFQKYHSILYKFLHNCQNLF